MTTEKSLVFIVSGGRTGTNFFGEGLSQVIEGAYSEHEPDLYAGLNQRTFARIRRFGWWQVIFGKMLGVTGLRTIGTRYLTGSLSAEVCRRRMAAFRERYHASIDQPLIIESNAQWWYLVDLIGDVWPQARVIAIIRDPRTWVRSWINKGGRYDHRDRVPWAPPGRLTPAKLGDSAWVGRWPGLDTFGKLAWEWNAIYSRLDAHVARDERARMFRFEDLFSDDDAPLRSLVEFAATHPGGRRAVGDLGGFTGEVKNASSGSATDWPDWRPDQARLLNELCGPLMARHGYGQEPEWQALLDR